MQLTDLLLVCRGVGPVRMSAESAAAAAAAAVRCNTAHETATVNLSWRDAARPSVPASDVTTLLLLGTTAAAAAPLTRCSHCDRDATATKPVNRLLTS